MITLTIDHLQFKVEDEGKNYWALLLVTLSVCMVSGNVLVIMSVVRERALQNMTNYFIVSLASADLLVAGLVMPFTIYALVSKIEVLYFVRSIFSQTRSIAYFTLKNKQKINKSLQTKQNKSFEQIKSLFGDKISIYNCISNAFSLLSSFSVSN